MTSIWKVATSAKKDTGPATRQIDQIVLLLGVADVAASKRFYVDRGHWQRRRALHRPDGFHSDHTGSPQFTTAPKHAGHAIYDSPGRNVQ